MKLIPTLLAAAALSAGLTAQASVIGQNFEAGLYVGNTGGLSPGQVTPWDFIGIPLNGPTLPASADVGASDAATYASAVAGPGVEFAYTEPGASFSIDVSEFELTLSLAIGSQNTNTGALVVIVDSMNPLLNLFNLASIGDNFGAGGWQILDVASTTGLSNISSGQRLAFGVQQQSYAANTTYTARFQFEPVLNTAPPLNGVPEPTALALVGLALAGLTATRRRASPRRQADVQA